MTRVLRTLTTGLRLSKYACMTRVSKLPTVIIVTLVRNQRISPGEVKRLNKICRVGSPLFLKNTTHRINKIMGAFSVRSCRVTSSREPHNIHTVPIAILIVLLLYISL